MSEYRPWPVRDALWADSTLRTFADSLNEAGVILTFSKVLWANARTTLWTFGFSCLYLEWFSSLKWYFVWANRVNPGQSWILRRNVLICRSAPDLKLSGWDYVREYMWVSEGEWASDYVRESKWLKLRFVIIAVWKTGPGPTTFPTMIKHGKHITDNREKISENSDELLRSLVKSLR